MKIFKEIDPLRLHLQHQKNEGLFLGLVPTMGALHEGHLSLIRASRSITDISVCSLYVNPTQFNNQSDLEKYPRTIEKDIAILESAGCDVLFCPETAAMYERPGIIHFDFGALDKILEGKFRPGHFSGVATVVSKLFNIIEPHEAFFGQKDYQQVQVITRMVEELKFNVKINTVPTIREASGLAMSSRNMRLTEAQRKKATILHQSLSGARKLLLEGQSWDKIQPDVIDHLNNIEEVRTEYFELAHRDDLTIQKDFDVTKGVLLTACFVGEVRLIDNMLI